MYHEMVLALAWPIAGFVVLYWGVIAKLVHDWATDDNYSHGFAIVPLAIYFAYERRAALTAATPRPSNVGLVIILGSLALLVAGTLGSELFLARLSMVTMAAGLVVFTWGWEHARVLRFPLAFLLLMIPIPAIIFNQMAFPLQLLASRVGEWTLQAASIPVLREGNVIQLANATLEVAEACSGIRSLVTLFTLGLVLGYFTDSRGWFRAVLALAAVPVAIFANGIRVAGTGIAAHVYGAEAAMGFFHTFSGWLVFLVAFGMLMLVQRACLAIRPMGRATHPRYAS